MSRRRSTWRSVWVTVAEESLDTVVGILRDSGSSRLGMLQILGSDEEEQVRTLTDLLRNSSEEEINDLMNRLTQAIRRLDEDREPARRRPRPRSRSGSPGADGAGPGSRPG